MKSKYSKDQFDSGFPDGIGKHWWYLARNKIIADTIYSITNQCSILEVGCGPGIVVEALRNHGINCYGVELADMQPLESVEEYIITGVDATGLNQETI